jgi:hypothetical protein
MKTDILTTFKAMKPPKFVTYGGFNKTLGLGVKTDVYEFGYYHILFLGLWFWGIDLFRWKMR